MALDNFGFLPFLALSVSAESVEEDFGLGLKRTRRSASPRVGMKRAARGLMVLDDSFLLSLIVRLVLRELAEGGASVSIG